MEYNSAIRTVNPSRRAATHQAPLHSDDAWAEQACDSSHQALPRNWLRQRAYSHSAKLIASLGWGPVDRRLHHAWKREPNREAGMIVVVGCAIGYWPGLSAAGALLGVVVSAPAASARPRFRRYEWAKPGDMIHIDVKKIGRIPDGGGWRVHGRGSTQHKATGRAKSAGARAGYVYLHTAIDDHSRLAYTGELLDEKGTTAAAFWGRAVKFFRRHGIKKIYRVLTDNGSCYRSLVFAAALARSRTRHKRTRPYRPQTNGKVERYHRTLAREWAYRRAWASNDERAADLQRFLDRYNYARPHTALKGRPPVSRVPGVTNLAA